MRRFMQDRQVQTVARELNTIIPVAQQQAILQPAVLGLQITAHQYAFYRFIINTKSNTGFWQLISRDRVLTNKILPAQIKLAITTAQQNLLTNVNAAQPQIIFFPSGDMTPFTITIGATKQPGAYNLIGQANGSVMLKTLDNP